MDNQAQPIAPGLQEPPPSPWRRKFGGHLDTLFNHPNEPFTHSGLAPLFPPLHPTYYAEEVTFFGLDPYPRPSDYDLDMLFGTEKAQLAYNVGLTTWEMGVLGEHTVGGLPGGHRRADTVVSNRFDFDKGVRVDENSWHPVFAKNRWYDFRVPIVDQTFIRHPLPGINASDVWSVDVPLVWTELRVSIELANRWLCHMANGRWLNNMMYEPWEEWMEAEPTDPEDPGLGQTNKKPWRIPVVNGTYDGEKAFRDIAATLTPRFVWTFVDDGYHTYENADIMDHYGRTIKHWNGGEEPSEDTPEADRDAFITSYIHVRPLRVLLNPDSTLSERCQARWSLAMTMLHELMHAINCVIHISVLDPPPEPFYGNEWCQELGSSGINSFFGKDIHEAPVADTAGKSGYKYGMSMVDFPSASQGIRDSIRKLNGNPVVHLGQINNVSPLPIAWSSATLVEDFYTSVAQRYGLAAFQAPKLFISNRIFRGFYTETERAQPVHTTLPVYQADLFPEISRTLDDLRARRLLWSQLRPWYEPAHRLWQRTPYSNVDARSILAHFTAAVQPWRRATEAAALDAERTANSLIGGMFYWLTVHRREGRDVPHPRRDWVFAVLAIMMRTVLPARVETGFEHASRIVPNTWFPSQAAAQGGNGGWKFAENRRVWTELQRQYTLPRRHMEGRKEYDEFGNEVGYVSNRVWLLQQAADIKQRCEADAPLPLTVSAALDSQLQWLFQQATTIIDEEDWLEWQFDFPEYSSHDLYTTDAGGNRVHWVEFTPGLPEQGFYGPHAQAYVQARVSQVLPGQRHRFKRRDRLQPIRYFTVSEVGDRISDDPGGTNWALLPDGQRGWDVFDVSAVLKDNPTLDVETVFERSELGRKIASYEIVEALSAKGEEPLGKLLTWKHPQEISEHDGRYGRDLWCVVGNFVYDITNFPFHSEDEKQAFTAMFSKGNLHGSALDSSDMSAFLERLAPYRCGFLKQVGGFAQPPQQTFTLRELGRYIYPQTGMYCAIDGGVYDLGRYIHSHPGGTAILHQYAGRDATGDFYEAHRDWAQTLKDHCALVVGRIVEERVRTRDIDEDEIVLQNQVYRFSGLTAEEDRLYDGLEPYGGTDASHALRASDTPYALRQLLRRSDLVCAKLVSGRKRFITPAELQKRNNIPGEKERREPPRPGDTNWRVWVSVPEAPGSGRAMVYDVTATVMFGGPELEERIRPWLGGIVRDAELANMLRVRYQGFVIGELLGGDRDAGTGAKEHLVTLRPLPSAAGSKKRPRDPDDDDVEMEMMDRSKWLKIGG